MDQSLITLHTSRDLALVEQIVDALRARGLTAVRLETDEGWMLQVPAAEVAASAAILAEFLPQGGVRASAPRPVPVADAQPPPALAPPSTTAPPHVVPTLVPTEPPPAPPPAASTVMTHVAPTAPPRPAEGTAPPPATEESVASLLALISLFPPLGLALVGLSVKDSANPLFVLGWFIAAFRATRVLKAPGTASLGPWSMVVATWAYGLMLLLPYLRATPASEASTHSATLTAMQVTAGLAVVLAIGGLIQSAVQKRSVGRSWALTTLVAAGLFGLAWKAAQRFQDKLADPSEVASLTREQVFDDLNFRFTRPTGWRSHEARRLNKDATLVIADPNEVMFMVIAEKGFRRDFTSADLLAVARKGVHELVPAMPADATFTLSGQPAARERTWFTAPNGTRLASIRTALVSRGYGYQLMCWAERNAHEAIEAPCAAAFAGFSLIDPSRSGTLEKPAPPLFESKAGGFSLQLQSGWAPLSAEEKKKEFPSALYAASCNEGESKAAVYAYPVVDFDYADDLVTALTLSFFNLKPELATPEVVEVRGQRHRQYLVHDDDGFTDHLVVVERDGDRLLVLLESRVARAGCVRAVEGLTRSTPEALPSSPESSAALHLEAAKQLAARDDLAGAVTACERALMVDPRSYPAAWKLVELAEEDEAVQPVVDAAFTRVMKGRPPSDPMNISFASFLSKTERQARAAKTYERLFASGFDDDDVFADWMHTLEALKQSARAWALTKARQKRHDTPRLAMLEAGMLSRGGKVAAAATLLERRLARGFDAPTASLLVAFLWRLERYEDVIGWSTKVIAAGDAGETNYEYKSAAELELSRYAAARRTAEAGLRLFPKNTDLISLQRDALERLGQGKNEALREPIAVVPLPEVAPPSAPRAVGEHESEYLLVGRAVHFVPGSEYRETTTLRLHIASDEDLERFSTMSFTINPRFERAFLNSLVVKDAAGKTVGTGSPDDCYLADEADDEKGTSERTLYVPVPGLAVGTTLELVLSTERLTGPGQLPFDAHFFGRGVAVRQSVLSIDAPASAVKVVTTGHVTERSPRLYVAEGLAPFEGEPYAPSWERTADIAWLVPANSTWALELDDYVGEAGPVLALDPAVTALGAKLTSGQTVDEKVVTLTRYVASNVTYKAIEFGRGARVPRRPSEVLSRRYGDCKDQSLLLVNLLRGAGVEAELALVKTDGDVRRDAPSLDQFDHVIVFVSGSTVSFVDPTMRMNDPLGGPGSLAGTDALLVSTRPPRFVTIPLPTTRREVEVSRTLALEGELLAVHEEVKLSGSFAQTLRAELSGVNAQVQRERVGRWLGEQAEVSKLALANLDEPRQPLVLDVEYRLRQAVRRASDTLVITPPASWELQRTRVPRVARRTRPLESRFPFSIHSTTKLRDGLQARDSSEASATALGVSWAVSPSVSGRELTYRREPVQGPSEDYQTWWSAHDRLTSALGEPFLVPVVPRRAD